MSSCCRNEEALCILEDVKDPRRVKGSDGWTLLHIAAAYGWTNIVELLVSECKCDVIM